MHPMRIWDSSWNSRRTCGASVLFEPCSWANRFWFQWCIFCATSSCHRMASAYFSYSPLVHSLIGSHPKKGSQRDFGYVPFVSKQLAIQTFSQHLEHIRAFVADICPCEYKCDDFTSVITCQMELEPMAPTMDPLPSVAIPLNTLLAYRLILWHTGIMVESTNVMPGGSGRTWQGRTPGLQAWQSGARRRVRELRLHSPLQ